MGILNSYKGIKYSSIHGPEKSECIIVLAIYYSRVYAKNLTKRAEGYWKLVAMFNDIIVSRRKDAGSEYLKALEFNIRQGSYFLDWFAHNHRPR